MRHFSGLVRHWFKGSWDNSGSKVHEPLAWGFMRHWFESSWDTGLTVHKKNSRLASWPVEWGLTSQWFEAARNGSKKKPEDGPKGSESYIQKVRCVQDIDLSVTIFWSQAVHQVMRVGKVPEVRWWPLTFVAGRWCHMKFYHYHTNFPILMALLGSSNVVWSIACWNA